MKSLLFAAICLVALTWAPAAEASVFLPKTSGASSSKHFASSSPFASSREARHELRWQLRQQENNRALTKSSAMAIPGYGVAEQGAFFW